MSGFSGVLKITDLNDFITPSQECIKPVQIEKTVGTGGKLKIEVESDGSFVEVDQFSGAKKKLVPAAITLQDCLACSGCVTSAETVLIEQQSHEQFARVLDAKLKSSSTEPHNSEDQVSQSPDISVVVVSVSPQSRASLAARHGLTLKECAEKLQTALQSLGVDYVLDTSFARHLSLLASGHEFVKRKKHLLEEVAPGAAAGPILSSACPGWICYAEKSHGATVLPHISRVRSPQAIMGAFVKQHFAQQIGVPQERIYHATIMPCFDKKLEASRDDFLVPGTSIRETDCVISSVELELLLDLKSIILEDLSPTPFTKFGYYSGINPISGRIYHHRGGGSGGFADFVFRFAAKEMYSWCTEGEELQYRTVRNKDFLETDLLIDGKPVMRFAKAYGFRNIQNVVQKLKKNKSNYDYVEVMACPSGCLNGGGQIRAADLSEQAEILSSVEQLYESSEVTSPLENSHVTQLIVDWLDGSFESDMAQKVLFTEYHEVEKMDFTLNIKW